MTNMLDATDVLVVPVRLAIEIGVPKAVVIRQAWWHMRKRFDGNVEWEGRRWFKQPMEMWLEDFPFWSKRTVYRYLGELEDEGILISSTEINRVEREGVVKNYYRSDKTKWYTVDEDHPALQIEVANGSDNLAPGDNLSQNDDNLSQICAKLAGSSSIKNKESKELSVLQTEGVIEKHLGKKEDRTEALKKANDRPDHGPTLSDYWRGTLSHYGHAASTQSEMTAAEVGMLKTLVKALPSVDYLDDVLKHWPKFQNFAREEYDVKLPARPRVKNLAGIRDVIAEFQTQSNQLDEDLTLPDGTVVGSDDWQDDWVPPD